MTANELMMANKIEAKDQEIAKLKKTISNLESANTYLKIDLDRAIDETEKLRNRNIKLRNTIKDMEKKFEASFDKYIKDVFGVEIVDNE